MADPNAVATIRAYLEHHRHTYDREALRQKLLADGHDPAAIDLAVAQVYGLQIAPGASPTPQRDSAWQMLAAIFGTVLINFIALAGLAVLVVRGIALSEPSVFPTLGFVIFGLCLAAEMGAALRFWRRNRGLARGFVWGLAITLLPVTMGALGFGVCVALLSSSF
jgi:hypothetical protein